MDHLLALVLTEEEVQKRVKLLVSFESDRCETLDFKKDCEVECGVLEELKIQIVHLPKELVETVELTARREQIINIPHEGIHKKEINKSCRKEV